MIFGNDQFDIARQDLAEGEPAGLLETISSSFREGIETRTSWGDDRAMREVYSGYLRDVEDRTGSRLTNPMDVIAPGGDLVGISAHARARAAAETELTGQIEKLRERFPDLPLKSPEDIRSEVAGRRTQVRAERSEVAGRESGFLSGAAALVGSAGAVMLDPPVLGSMAFGAPLAAGILRGVAIDAAIGAGSEAVVQGAVQAGRTEFGEKADLGEAAESIAMAAGGTAVFSGALRAAAAGARSVMKRVRAGEPIKSDVVDAAAYIERQSDLEASNPFRDTPEGPLQHAERMDAALEAVRAGRVADLPPPAEAPAGMLETAARATDLDDVETVAMAEFGRVARDRLPDIEAARIARAVDPAEPRLDAELLAQKIDAIEDDTAAILADVRRDFIGRENEIVHFDNEDGTTTRMTISELLNDFELDDVALAQFQGCLR